MYLSVHKCHKILKLVIPLIALTSTIWVYSILTASTTNLYISNKIEYFMTNTVIQPSQNICATNPYLILLVSSNVRHSQRRINVRKNQVLHGFDFIRIFMVGKPQPGSPLVQKRIETENRNYGDILQGSFDEHYRNLTYKTLMGLHWAATRCASANYVIKARETSFWGAKEIFLLLKHLDGYNKDSLLVGKMHIKKKPQRDPTLRSTNQDYVSWDEFGGLFFPPHVSDYVTTPHVAAKLTSEAPNHKYLFLEDVFITGILSEAARIPVKDFSEIRF